MSVRVFSILDHRMKPFLVNQGAYDAAGTSGWRARGWHAPGSGPNQALSHNLATLRNRSRAADRNNPWVWQAIDRLVSNEVGIGVTLRSRSKDEGFRQSVNELWQCSRGELDPEGVLNFGGLQAQAVRARLDSGLAVLLQIQVLDAEFVPLGFNQDLPNGRTIRDAIEFNRRGQRLAYWMQTAHPQDDVPDRNFGNLIRVPARDVIHHYLPTRPGQHRGRAQLGPLPARGAHLRQVRVRGIGA